MFNSIKTYFQVKKTKRQLKKVLGLLYSKNRFETDDIILALNPKDEIEAFELQVILEIAAKLERPFTEGDITKIYEELLEALECYVASKEIRENILKLVKTKADLSMLHFNVFMDRLRSAYEFNNYSPGGMLYSSLIAKGRPLTEAEAANVEFNYKEIKRLEKLADEKTKELEDLINKKS